MFELHGAEGGMCRVCFHIHLQEEESLSVLILNMHLREGFVTSQLVWKSVTVQHSTYTMMWKLEASGAQTVDFTVKLEISCVQLLN